MRLKAYELVSPWCRHAGGAALNEGHAFTQGGEGLLLHFVISPAFQPELLVMLPVAQPFADRGSVTHGFVVCQCLPCQRFAKPRQLIATLGLGLGAKAHAAEPGKTPGQNKQRCRVAGFQFQFQLVDPAATQAAVDFPLIPGQLDLGPVEGDQPVAAQEIGTELGNQLLLDTVTLGQSGPDVVGKGGEGGQIAVDGSVVFGSGVQSAHDLTAALDGLFGKFIAAADPQSHLEAAQGQIWGIEIDVAKALLRCLFNIQ